MTFLLFGILIICLLAGFPVAFTLGGVSTIFGLMTFGMDFFNLIPLRIWGIMTNYILLAVPLFVFMGVMLEKSGIAATLLETMALLFGRMRGGLAYSIITVGAILAATTGIVGATVVTMGMLSLPTMIKRGYHPMVATGAIAASGTLGQIIPPSIILVLLGSVLNVPVGDLFMGAVIPGLLLVFLYFCWIFFLTLIKPEWVPAMPADELAAFKGIVIIKRLGTIFFPALILVLGVLGSIFFGIASPTEAAGIGAIIASGLAAFQGKLKRATLIAVMKETTILTSMVFTILVGATIFGLTFRGIGGDIYLKNLIIQSNLSPQQFLFLVMLVVFVAGFFIDFIEIVFIIVPVVYPIFQHLGVNPLWLGILLSINLQTSFLTPPFGFALFYLKGVAPKEITTIQIYKGAIPYIIIQLILLILIIVFPELTLMLPQMGKNE